MLVLAELAITSTLVKYSRLPYTGLVLRSLFELYFFMFYTIKKTSGELK